MHTRISRQEAFSCYVRFLVIYITIVAVGHLSFEISPNNASKHIYQ